VGVAIHGFHEKAVKTNLRFTSSGFPGGSHWGLELWELKDIPPLPGGTGGVKSP
jgi:hypothetical protein